MKNFLRNFTSYLIYLAVLARAVGWTYAQGPLRPVIWILLGIYGLALFSESVLTGRWRWYPRLYILVQACLVIFLVYRAPTLDFIPLLFFPLSFQAVQFFGDRIGFTCIAAFTLAMAGMFFFGMEWGPGILMILLSGASNVLMGSYAHLITRTEKARRKNQRFFSELQGAYRQLKDQALQQEQWAAAQERHRLARELHDTLTQTLFSMNLAVQSALISVQETPQQTDAYLLRFQNLARNASQEIKGFKSQASPRPGLAKGLAEAIHELVHECRVRDNLLVSLEMTGNRRFPEAVEANLFRIVQEGLNNVVRHAGVDQAWVKICLEGEPAYLEVRDSGRGFETDKAGKTRGFGLGGMAERAGEIGWELEIKSRPGEGACITVREKAA